MERIIIASTTTDEDVSNIGNFLFLPCSFLASPTPFSPHHSKSVSLVILVLNVRGRLITMMSFGFMHTRTRRRLTKLCLSSIFHFYRNFFLPFFFCKTSWNIVIESRFYKTSDLKLFIYYNILLDKIIFILSKRNLI